MIALTHMRWNNDRRLAEHSQYIDMVLGGHDHNYGLEYVSQLPQHLRRALNTFSNSQ